ncbi:MAG: hypothetical protein V1724_07345, partial [Chloroflexota bacterium]
AASDCVPELELPTMRTCLIVRGEASSHKFVAPLGTGQGHAGVALPLTAECTTQWGFEDLESNEPLRSPLRREDGPPTRGRCDNGRR